MSEIDKEIEHRLAMRRSGSSSHRSEYLSEIADRLAAIEAEQSSHAGGHDDIQLRLEALEEWKGHMEYQASLLMPKVIPEVQKVCTPGQEEDSLAVGAGASGGAPQSSSEQAGAGESHTERPTQGESGSTVIASPADLLDAIAQHVVMQCQGGLHAAYIDYAADVLIEADREAVRRKAWIDALRWVNRLTTTGKGFLLQDVVSDEIARLGAGGEVPGDE